MIISDSPSAFVLEWLPRLATGPRFPIRALDLAMGRGRHTLALARAGLRTFGVDWRFDAVQDARNLAEAAGVSILVWCADLSVVPLPQDAFDVVLVTRYLDRALFPAIRHTVVRGGVVLYETFTVDQLLLNTGPTSPAHLLGRGELASHFQDFDVLFVEETTAPEAVARLVARRPL